MWGKKFRSINQIKWSFEPQRFLLRVKMVVFARVETNLFWLFPREDLLKKKLFFWGEVFCRRGWTYMSYYGISGRVTILLKGFRFRFTYQESKRYQLASSFNAVVDIVVWCENWYDACIQLECICFKIRVKGNGCKRVRGVKCGTGHGEFFRKCVLFFIDFIFILWSFQLISRYLIFSNFKGRITFPPPFPTPFGLYMFASWFI